MLRASTAAPSLAICTTAGSVAAVLATVAAGRACSPARVAIVTVRGDQPRFDPRTLKTLINLMQQ